MVSPETQFDAAIASYQRTADEEAVELAEKERQDLIRRFPREEWPQLPLERYALGLGNRHDSLCWLLEFGTPHTGSIKGGSARKHIIYRHRDGTWIYDQTRFPDVQSAWEDLRGGFVRAFELAEAGRWDEIDQLEALYGGPALRTKTLYCYFPEELLPINSLAHMTHFLGLLGRSDVDTSSYEVVRINRLLLETLRERPELKDWTPKQLERLLYYWSDPRERKRVVKIAPGENARFWDECLADNFICVGWDEVEDLRQFDSREQYMKEFERACGEMHNHHKPTLTKKAKEVWTLRDMEPGDLIVANRGTSRILAVGEVVEPGYEWREDRAEYRHVVRVKEWDTSFACEIPPQKAWAMQTVAPVSQELATRILTKDHRRLPARSAPVDPHFAELAHALERKGQAVLYGPPGTGKTYTARRFSIWWLLQKLGREGSEPLIDPAAFAQVERELAGAGKSSQRVGHLTRLTFHASYSYEDFIEGFRPVQSDNGQLTLRLEDGIFKRVCRQAESDPDRPYLVLIDEINRANVAKVLGELITLLEKDKRGLQISLPQSKEDFTIPPNVYVLGTMNTADRSIKLLDAALRRRFAFLELMPDASVLQGGKVGNLPLDDFLDALNRRVAAREGREKQIGHSFLLEDNGPVSEPEEFGRRFRQEILPLLQEYCYDDYQLLAKYVGEALVDPELQTLNHERLHDTDQLIEVLEALLENGEQA